MYVYCICICICIFICICILYTKYVIKCTLLPTDIKYDDHIL